MTWPMYMRLLHQINSYTTYTYAYVSLKDILAVWNNINSICFIFYQSKFRDNFLNIHF